MSSAAPYLQLSACMLLSASHVVLGKIVMRSFPIYFASGATMGLTALIYVLIVCLRGLRLPRLTAREILLVVLQAFGGLFLYRILILVGLRLTGAIEAGIVLSTTPVVVGLLAFLILHERATWKTAAAIVLCSLGIVVLNLPNGTIRSSPLSRLALGSLLLFVAVLGDSLYTVFRKVLSHRISALANATMISVLCFAMFLPLILSDLRKMEFTGIPLQSWLILIYYGTVVPSLSFVLWFSGVGKVGASMAGIFSSLLPIFTLILSLLILRERLVWMQLIGMGIIICGILVSVRKAAA